MIAYLNYVLVSCPAMATAKKKKKTNKIGFLKNKVEVTHMNNA